MAVRVLSRVAAALTHRDFRILWLGAAISTIGTWMQKVAQNWLVLTITGSAFYLGLDSFVGELPILLFTRIGGVIADRHNRRRLLIASQHVQMACAFTLMVLVYWDVVTIWHVLALSFVGGTAQAFYQLADPAELILTYAATASERIEANPTPDTTDWDPTQNPTKYGAAVLALDFLDASTNTRVWRGAAMTDLRSGEGRQKVGGVVVLILEEFPPR